MSTADRTLKFDRLACITIQGGSVFGINLLGQLQAVLELGFLPVALSGTSAGPSWPPSSGRGWTRPRSSIDWFARPNPTADS